MRSFNCKRVWVVSLLCVGVLHVGTSWASGPDNDDKIAFRSSRDGNQEIYVMGADGSTPTRLTFNEADDSGALWSPDGRSIAFHSKRDGDREIYVMDADGTNVRCLTENAIEDLVGGWSPDGRQIGFDSTRDGNFEIYVMQADGSQQTRLTDNPANDLDPAFSPDGSRIAFTSDRDGNDEVYVMNADGSNPTRLTHNEGLNSAAPVWSPDGRRIAFETIRDGNWEIYVMQADGSNQTRLTTSLVAPDTSTWSDEMSPLGPVATTPLDDVLPAWSPDGSRIAFASKRDGNWEIYVMNADGSDQTRLTHDPGMDWGPGWGRMVNSPPLASQPALELDTPPSS